VVGLTVQFELKSALIKRKRIQTTVVGWSNPNFVMVQLYDMDPELYSISLETEIIGRYVLQGKVIGFVSRIQFKQSKPIHLWYISYPMQMEVLNLRQSVRIPLALEVQTAAGDLFVSRDISRSGASLLRKPNSQKIKIDIGEEINLIMVLPDQTKLQDLKATVTRKSVDKDQFLLGVQFNQENNPDLNLLITSIEKIEALYAPPFEKI
jgi:hypothetical protein